MKEIVIAASTFVLGYFVGVGMCASPKTPSSELRVLTLHDTVRIQMPPLTRIVELPPDTVWLPTVGSDSVLVPLPREQAVYQGEGYKAYVSGFRPRLDSLMTVNTTVHTARTVLRPPRFSIGVQAGYGLTPKGVQPYIGVGLSYTLRIP